MKTVKAFGPQDLRVVERADPEPGPDEVLVETRACGICGSDKWFWHVETPSDYVAGHEAAGVIVRTGAGVTGFKPGDRVAVNNVKGCGECDQCRAGRFVRCGGAPLVHMGFGFAERMAVPACNCLPLDPAISFEQGALLFDNWGTPYSALKRTHLGAGDSVLVTGCGPIGLATVALCKAKGAIAAAVDPIAARREAALRLGASIAVSPDEAAAGRLRAFSGDSGFGYGVDCSGKAASYDLIFEHIAIGGTIVTIGEGAKFAFDSSRLIHKHLTLVGSLYSTMEDGAELQRMAVAGELDPLAFVTHRFRLADLPSEFGKVMGGDDTLLKAVVLNEAPFENEPGRM
ncbi:(R,R)-butanediol dehydrogenase / meso-butanediol dehydrogenase / diacetyl reductase [Cohnella sp. OV330]|uniref:zinc-dependent alcohol dehydrogenase n=1 Tax=Cohnella sp. OV330 TaxID=1855288 RepID=UPI0008E6CD53|nr:alcohol dehydrogenase catalytic domain-containing protein [Cohnella sp. OV330]SFB57635.1 (R,R)-butanediol dehydrogenase / meso-butanediol dehydrogenase / diacetyl reductase [Cohnella sp. OV330]